MAASTCRHCGALIERPSGIRWRLVNAIPGDRYRCMLRDLSVDVKQLPDPWPHEPVLPEAWERVRMCIADLGLDPSLIRKPGAEEAARGLTFVYDPRLPGRAVWMSACIGVAPSEVAPMPPVCWACVEPWYASDETDERGWEPLAQRCLARREAVPDCGLDPEARASYPEAEAS